MCFLFLPHLIPFGQEALHCCSPVFMVDVELFHFGHHGFDCWALQLLLGAGCSTAHALGAAGPLAANADGGVQVLFFF